MRNSHHSGHGIGLALLAGAITFAFGKNVARVVVGGALIVVALFFVYVMFRVIMGTI